MKCCFGIVPDGQGRPAAVFEDLEDAIEWGLQRFGGDAFSIRHVNVTEIEKDDPKRSAA